jgi:hypothetical protein
MAKAKKTKTVEEVKEVKFINVEESSMGELKIQQKRIHDCEWVFQFDEDEPQVFACTDPEMDKNEDPKIIFSISNIENSYINFKNNKNEKSFKIYARQITNEGIDLRQTQRNLLKRKETELENFEQKIEEYASENKEA